MHDVFILQILLIGNVAYCGLAKRHLYFSECEFYGSVVQLRKFFSNKNGSLSKCFFNEHKLTFSQFLRGKKKGQYQTGYTGNIKTGSLFNFLYKTGIFLDFLKKQTFSKRILYEKMKNGHITNGHFLKISYRDGHFTDFQSGKKKNDEQRCSHVSIIIVKYLALWDSRRNWYLPLSL